ncbi:MAG: phage holin family protein [Opitutaceae bacterium]|nr:phage holin family protein [Opitutaceae bacterium]
MNAASADPLTSVLGPAARIVVEGLAHRGELAALEFAEARDHVVKSAAVMLGATACALLTGFAGTFAIAALVWQREDRGLILGLVTLAYALGAAGLGLLAARRLRAWRPLAETRHQLGEDCACVRDMLPAAKS